MKTIITFYDELPDKTNVMYLPVPGLERLLQGDLWVVGRNEFPGDAVALDCVFRQVLDNWVWDCLDYLGKKPTCKQYEIVGRGTARVRELIHEASMSIIRRSLEDGLYLPKDWWDRSDRRYLHKWYYRQGQLIDGRLLKQLRKF